MKTSLFTVFFHSLGSALSFVELQPKQNVWGALWMLLLHDVMLIALCRHAKLSKAKVIVRVSSKQQLVPYIETLQPDSY